MEFETCIGIVKITDDGDIIFRQWRLGTVEKLSFPIKQIRNGKQRIFNYEAYTNIHNLNKLVVNYEEAAHFVARMSLYRLRDAGQL